VPSKYEVTSFGTVQNSRGFMPKALSIFDVEFQVPDYGIATTAVLFTVEVDRSQTRYATAELSLGSPFGHGLSYEPGSRPV
jgi:hypothetical protein